MKDLDLVLIKDYNNVEINKNGNRISNIIKSSKQYILNEAKERLIQASNLARESGYKILIYGTLRSISEQQNLWNMIQDKSFLYNPNIDNEIPNCSGKVIDLTLIHATQHSELPLGCDVYEFSEKSKLTYTKIEKEYILNRLLLSGIMYASGFVSDKLLCWSFRLNNH